MKRLVALLSLGLSILCGTSAHATALSNTQLTGAAWLGFFPNVFDVSSTATIDIGADGTIDGTVFSGVTKATFDGEDWYTYFYKVGLLNTTHVISGLSFNWGGVAPLPFDFDGAGINYSATDDSWYGSSADGWSAGTFPPLGAAYTSASGVARFTWFGDELASGETSAFMILLSHSAPGTVDANILDGGPPEVAGSVYAPVPEPGTLLLLGSGISTLVLRRRRKS